MLKGHGQSRADTVEGQLDAQRAEIQLAFPRLRAGLGQPGDKTTNSVLLS